MSNPIVDLVSRLKQVRLSRIAIAVAAGLVLMFNTACNPSSPSVSGTGSYQSGRNPQTELYRTNQPKQGGPNVYSDTDPRRNTRGLGAESKARIDQAERNVNKVQNPSEFAEEYRKGTPLGERIRNVTENVGDAAKDASKDFTKGTERGINNLKRNTEQAKREVGETVNDTRQDATEFGKDSARNAQRAADRVKTNLDNARQEVGNKVSSSNRDDQFTARSSEAGRLQSNQQPTPKLDAKDLVERAKDTFGSATRNVNEM